MCVCVCERERERERERRRERERERERGDVVVVAARVLHRIAIPSDISPLLMQRRQVAELRNFSDRKSCPQFFHVFA